jgi:hypothetical protein
MEHVKLFEDFGKNFSKNFKPSPWIKVNQNKPEGDILIGFFADGGIGSHPAIIESAILPQIDSKQKFNLFQTTESTNVMPEALLAIFSDSPDAQGSDGWYIKGISNSLAREIIKSGDSDVYTNQSGESFLRNSTVSQEAFDLAGYPYDHTGTDVQILSVIPNVSLNTVYWSDAPESSHSYWEPPYKAISIESLI